MKRRDFFKQTLAAAGLTAAGASAGNKVSAALAPTKVLEQAGTSSPSPTSYTRMFPNLPRATYSTESLEALAMSMKGQPDPNRQGTTEAHQKGLTLPSAGYTYLGQFIDHDLTLDLTSLEGSQSDETLIHNFRSPFLDLDHIYGGGPNLSPHLYKKHGKDSPDGAEKFLIGKTVKLGGGEGTENDLPRNPEGTALTSDPRQDENLILAQMHVAFLKLHNLVIGDPKLLQPYRGAGSDFAAAQRLVTWHYQWVVRHDYLETILDPAVVKIFGEIENQKRTNPELNFKIPIEFSAAAFRFGHSMVRDEYNIKNHRNAQLGDILGRTRAPLPDDWVITWERFFYGQGTCLTDQAQLESAQSIDTKIASGLYELDIGKSVRLFSAPMPEATSKSASRHGLQSAEEGRLPVRTLWRGAQMGLPSGQAVAKALGLTPLAPDKVREGLDKSIIDLHPFHEDTPLWYYILKEAETPPHSGQHLGPVGSHIVADVIIGALAADPISYFSDPSGWKPTLPYRGKTFGIANMLCFLLEGAMSKDIYSHQTG